MTHWRLDSWVWNSRRIVGTARFRIVLSSTGIATDTIATDAANQRRGSRCSSVGAAMALDHARRVMCVRMSNDPAVRPSHLGLCVGNMERSLRFYCEGLGFT